MNVILYLHIIIIIIISSDNFNRSQCLVDGSRVPVNRVSFTAIQITKLLKGTIMSLMSGYFRFFALSRSIDSSSYKRNAIFIRFLIFQWPFSDRKGTGLSWVLIVKRRSRKWKLRKPEHGGRERVGRGASTNRENGNENGKWVNKMLSTWGPDKY